MPRWPTGPIGQRQNLPLSARTNRAHVVKSACHSGTTPVAPPTWPDKLWPANSKSCAADHGRKGGTEPQAILEMEPRTALKYHHLDVPHTGSLTNCPASPFATPTASKLRFLLSQRPFATSPIITWSSVGGKGKGRAMSDRDMRSEARTFWIVPLPAQPLNRPTRVERGAHIV